MGLNIDLLNNFSTNKLIEELKYERQHFYEIRFMYIMCNLFAFGGIFILISVFCGFLANNKTILFSNPLYYVIAITFSLLFILSLNRMMFLQGVISFLSKDALEIAISILNENKMKTIDEIENLDISEKYPKYNHFSDIIKQYDYYLANNIYIYSWLINNRNNITDIENFGNALKIIYLNNDKKESLYIDDIIIIDELSENNKNNKFILCNDSLRYTCID